MLGECWPGAPGTHHVCISTAHDDSPAQKSVRARHCGLSCWFTAVVLLATEYYVQQALLSMCHPFNQPTGLLAAVAVPCLSSTAVMDMVYIAFAMPLSAAFCPVVLGGLNWCSTVDLVAGEAHTHRHTSICYLKENVPNLISFLLILLYVLLKPAARLKGIAVPNTLLGYALLAGMWLLVLMCAPDVCCCRSDVLFQSGCVVSDWVCS